MRSRCSPRVTSSWYSIREPSGTSTTTYHRSAPRHRRSGMLPGSPRSGGRGTSRLAPVQERAARSLDDRRLVPGQETVHQSPRKRPALPEPVDSELAAHRRAAHRGHAASRVATRRPRRVPGCPAGRSRRHRCRAGAVLQQDKRAGANLGRTPPSATHHRAATSRGVRQRYDAAEHTETPAEDLGVTESLRGAVLEEHDTVGQPHCAGRPRDHGRVWRWRDIEQVQGVRQHAHVPAGPPRGQRPRRAGVQRRRGARRSPAGRGSATTGRIRRGNRWCGASARRRARGRRRGPSPERRPGAGHGRCGAGWRRPPAAHDPGAADRSPAPPPAPPAAAARPRRSPGHDPALEPAPVQREIDIAGTELLAQRAVVGLALRHRR